MMTCSTQMRTARSLTIVRRARAFAVDAFIALGGNEDKTGQVSTEKLRHVIKEFGIANDHEKRQKRGSYEFVKFVEGNKPPLNPRGRTGECERLLMPSS